MHSSSIRNIASGMPNYQHISNKCTVKDLVCNHLNLLYCTIGVKLKLVKTLNVKRWLGDITDMYLLQSVF